MTNLAVCGKSSQRDHNTYSTTDFIIRKVNLAEEIIIIIYWYICFSASDKFQQSFSHILRKDHEQSKLQTHLKLINEEKQKLKVLGDNAEDYCVLILQPGFQYN